MKRSANPKLVLFAMLFMAVLCALAGLHGLAERQHLLNQGVATTGVAVGIHVGVKGMKNVEARFRTLAGDEVVGRDLHTTLWFDASEIGDQVSLYYDPQVPEKILISRGLALWSNPAFMLAGTVFLCVLAVFLYRQSKG